MKNLTEQEIDTYITWILEQSSTPYDEIKWLIEETNKQEVIEAVKTVNEIVNDL